MRTRFTKQNGHRWGVIPAWHDPHSNFAASQAAAQTRTATSQVITTQPSATAIEALQSVTPSPPPPQESATPPAPHSSPMLLIEEIYTPPPPEVQLPAEENPLRQPRQPRLVHIVRAASEMRKYLRPDAEAKL
jgi:hypothetical protein